LPKITVVLPLYNGAPYIEEALNSVFAQSLKPSEIILIDDGSTDRSRAIITRMIRAGRKITLLKKENGGQSAARNLGIRRAKSELIAFLDQDDVWYPHHLATLVTPFQQRRRFPLGWSYANMDLVDAAGRIIVRRFLDTLGCARPKRTLMECLREDMYVVPNSTLVSRSALLAVGGFDERLRGYEDDDLFTRLFVAGYDNVYSDESITKWRCHANSCSHSPAMIRSRAIYCKKLLEDFPDMPAIALHFKRDLLRPRFWSAFAGEYQTAVRSGNLALARACADGLAEFLPHMRPGLRPFMGVMLSLARSRAAPFLWPVTTIYQHWLVTRRW
jgi:glycosyltransferase involved in cell wall biosynthesis